MSDSPAATPPPTSAPTAPAPAAPSPAAAVTNAGGSALIRGVMMQVAGRIGVAARREDGTLVAELLYATPAPSRLPAWLRTTWGLRGVFGVGAGLSRSVEAMRWSSVQAGAPERFARSRGVGLLLAVVILTGASAFSLLPLYALHLLHTLLGAGVLAVALETIVRFGLIIGYMLLAARQKTVRETFAYHGAEHVTVSCYESGLPLTPENAAGFSTAHVRCGTNFTFLVLAGISLVATLAAALTGPAAVVVRILGVFLAAGLGYELMRACASRMDHRWARLAMAPGLAMQRLTTRTPSLAEIEVAILAFRTACTPELLAELDARSGGHTRAA